MNSHSKIRLDQLLVQRGLFESREKSQRAILAGAVFVNGQRADKMGTQYPGDCPIEVKARERYVSRGGLKLEKALDEFRIDPSGQVCADIGASTGGFTDCLLQRGATRVYAMDVGHSQLDWKIRTDPRVVVREKFNARHLTSNDLPEAVSLCVVDVSFISLTMILPALCAAVIEHASSVAAQEKVAIVLIKPQFELERGDVGRGGIVRDEALHRRAVDKIHEFSKTSLPHWRWTGVVDSPILGTEGNKEFLACLRS